MFILCFPFFGLIDFALATSFSLRRCETMDFNSDLAFYGGAPELDTPPGGPRGTVDSPLGDVATEEAPVAR